MGDPDGGLVDLVQVDVTGHADELGVWGKNNLVEDLSWSLSLSPGDIEPSCYRVGVDGGWRRQGRTKQLDRAGLCPPWPSVLLTVTVYFAPGVSRLLKVWLSVLLALGCRVVNSGWPLFSS